MKAILLAGGQGTRLRPLTLHTPKPIVPIFDRPFLHYQLDLLRSVPEIDEVILSLNYRPERIEAVFGDGRDLGLKIRYAVEPMPLGTGGAIKYSEPHLDGSVVVFNGDVLTGIDLPAVIRLHRERNAVATIVLTAVENPAAYGLVESDAEGNVTRFLEKPGAEEITTNRINAGIYVLEPGTFDRIPRDTPFSIERGYFPTLVERRERFVAYHYDGYWIDIGTPAKYLQVHRDIMSGHFQAAPFAAHASGHIVRDGAHIEDGAILEGPCFIGEGAVVKAGATVGPGAVIGRQSQLETGAVVEGAVVWPDTWVGENAVVRGAIVGRNCHIGPHGTVDAGSVLGDESVVTDFSSV